MSIALSFNIYIKSFFVEGTEKAVKEGIIEFAGDILKKGFKDGYEGERYMRNLYGASSYTFKNVKYVVDGITKSANRIIDGLVNGVAHESKVGYMSLTKFIKEEALKDYALLKRGDITESVWHFYRSAKTGKIGPSGPLKSFLEDHGD